MDDDGCLPSGRCDTRYRKALFIDALFFLLALVAVVFGILSDDFGDLVLTIPVLMITVSALLFDKNRIRMPPMMLAMFMASFYLSSLVRWFGQGLLLEAIALLFTGVNLALLGLIIVYMMLRKMPGVRDGSPRLVVMLTMAVSISTYTIMKLVQDYAAEVFHGISPTDPDVWNYGMLIVILGAGMVCISYILFPDRSLFRYTVRDFLLTNSDTLGIDDAEEDVIHRIIEVGENESIEFKSTVRTNLETGEVDKRMEKAVLKTLVAFMNTEGGTLLIGVADNGDIRGLDIESFESTDKLYLHFTNIVSSGIGNGMLPYISFRLTQFGQDRYVMRVTCKPSPKPVFFRDGKVEQFYVRSGPSSVELTGMTMVRYINNMSTKKGRHHRGE